MSSTQMDRRVNRCVFCVPEQTPARRARKEVTSKHVIALADREPIFWLCASRVLGTGLHWTGQFKVDTGLCAETQPLHPFAILVHNALLIELKPSKGRGIAGAWTTLSFFLVGLILRLCQYLDPIMSNGGVTDGRVQIELLSHWLLAWPRKTTP
jgi:hypothetical protein